MPESNLPDPVAGENAETAPAPASLGGAPAAPTHPWSADLETAFQDVGLRSQVNDFITAHTQPYVTRLEEEKAALEGRTALYDAFADDPAAAFVQVTTDLFGEAEASKILAVLNEEVPAGDHSNAPAEAVAAAIENDASATDEDRSWLKEFRAREEAKEAKAEYDEAVASIVAGNPHVKEGLFAPFVITAEGDMDAALAGYNEWAREGGLLNEGIDPSEVPDAPATLGDDGSATPPTVKKFGSMDEAIDDLLNDVRAPTTM